MNSLFPPIPVFVSPLPDESCYSVLCRCMVRASLSTHRFCLMMFNGQRNLNRYHWQPFRPQELRSWFENGETRIPFYMQEHSCIPYRYPVVKKPYREMLTAWNRGQDMSSGQHKRLTRELGFRAWTKEYLYYCPECARYDRERYGETYWHMIPQLPGVMACPIHFISLKASHIRFEDTQFELYPAEHQIPGQMLKTVTASADEIQIARESMWMMKNGWCSMLKTDVLQKINGMDAKQRYILESIAAPHTTRSHHREETLYLMLVINAMGLSISECIETEL